MALEAARAAVKAIDLRLALAWSLVDFFLRLRGIEWEDLPLEERFEAWKCAMDQR